MAYFLTYGNWDSPRHLVITTQNDGATITEWNEILGQSTAINIRYDGDTKNLYAPIIKTSLELSLFRQNDSEFIDIINGNDKEIRAYITEGERLTNDYKVTASSTLLFKGNLTFGTWTEKYAHVAPIKLTFHDRIGYLAEEKFLPLKRYMNFIEIIGDCLINVVSADKWLVLNWLYSYTESSTDYEYADDFYYDIASWVGKTKEQVIKDFMTSHGMQLLTDFGYKVGAASTDIHYNDVGAIRIRMLASQANSVNVQSLYQKKNKFTGANQIFYYDLELSETIVVEELKSSLFITITGESQTPLDFTAIEVEIGDNQYEVEISTTTGVIVAGTKTTIKILEYQYETNAVRNALLSLISDNYELVAGMIVAKVGSNDWDITVTTVATETIAEATNFGSSSTIITDGKFSEGRIERVMNNSDIPLLDNNTSYQIDTRAKEIVGVNAYDFGGMIFPDTILADYLVNNEDIRRIGSIPNTSRVFPFSFVISTENNATRFQIVKDFYEGNLTGRSGNPVLLSNAKTELVNNKLGIALESNAEYLYGEALVRRNTTTGMILTASGIGIDTGKTTLIKILPFVNIFNDWYYLDYVAQQWKIVDPVNFTGGLGVTITLSNNSEVSITRPFPTLPSVAGTSRPHKMHFLVSTTGSTPGEYAFLTALQVELVSANAYPDKLVLRTKINELNRQTVEFNAENYNVPEIAGAESVYRNGIFSTIFNPLYTVKYSDSSQTLLAHVSDMYAQNYAFNRWILKARIRIEKFRLHDLFTLDEKSFIFVNGTYDERRGFLDGTFIETKLPSRQAAWKWQTGEDMEWQNGTKILLQ
jgi:hypothetical protein